MPAALPPSDDDRPATRRDLAKEREIIGAWFAVIEQKFAMVEQKFALVEQKFATVDPKFDAVRAEISGLRREMRMLFGVVLVLLAALVARGGA